MGNCASSRKEFDAEVLSQPLPWSSQQSLGGIASLTTAEETTVCLNVQIFPPKVNLTSGDGPGAKEIGKGVLLSMMKKEGALIDADGARLAIGKGKTLPKLEIRVLRTQPSFKGQESAKASSGAFGEEFFAADDTKKANRLYQFAKITVTAGLTHLGAEYFVEEKQGPKLTATAKALVGGFKVRQIIYDATGECIGKVEQHAFAGKKVQAVIAAGVDQWAVVLLAMALLGGGRGSPAVGLQ